MQRSSSLVAVLGLLIILWACCCCCSVVQGQHQTLKRTGRSGGAPVVETGKGRIAGVDTGFSYEYRGIPFAQPPVGELRWRPPVEPAAWAPAVLEATASGPNCPQLFSQTLQSEDCLYLNVYLPRGAPPREGFPVMVFLYGGSFVFNGAMGSANASLLASQTNTVVVVPNYRLGILGLIGHPAFLEDSGTFGNYLLMDQVAALRWVNANIGAFGGNPSQVTLFGQSAGAISIGIHLTTTYTEGLFSQVIMESGAPTVLDSTAVYYQVSAEVQADLGCSLLSQNLSQTLACMRSANVSQILAVQKAMASFFTQPRPAIDGVFITEQPLALLARGLFQRGVTVVAGSNLNESTILDGQIPTFSNLNTTVQGYDQRVTSEFGAQLLPNISALYDISGKPGPLSLPTPYAGIAKVDTDHTYTCPEFHYLRLLAAHTPNVYYYQFVHHAPFALPQLGAFHTSELAYVFGHPCVVPVLDPLPPLLSFGPPCSGFDDPLPPVWDRQADRADFDLSAKLMALWARIATNGGNPNGIGVFWPAYQAVTGFTNLVIDVDQQAGTALFTTQQQANEVRCNFWDSILPPFCGDGICQSDENVFSCCLDCCS